ncbi:MAG TPA: hypothetical protein VG056_12510, partial [Pirellulales bacterium]|nr:hypothetical protein [Pirellulales bacterium]
MTAATESKNEPQIADGKLPPRAFNRRALLLGGGAAVAGLVGLPYLRRALAKKETAFIARGQRYDGPLEQTIR